MSNKPHWTDHLKGWQIFAIWMAGVIGLPVAILLYMGRDDPGLQVVAVLAGLGSLAFMTFFASMTDDWNTSEIDRRRETAQQLEQYSKERQEMLRRIQDQDES